MLVRSIGGTEFLGDMLQRVEDPLLKQEIEETLRNLVNEEVKGDANQRLQ